MATGMKRRRCEHKYWDTYVYRRPTRYCRFCRKRQFRDGGVWKDEITLTRFAEKWLPAVSGTTPKDMLFVDVAFPFEWNCYESWNVVMRVRFDFSSVLTHSPLSTTRTSILDGWESKYHEDLNGVDYELEQYYLKETGRNYQIGDNTYEEMRRIIQS